MKRFIPSSALTVLLAVATAHAADYYVDSADGNDVNTGLSPTTAWKSLAHVNTHTFQPGDTLSFRSGQTFAGQLAPKGSGALVDGKRLPITIDAYTYPVGDKITKPRIEGEGKVLDTLLLRNASYWTIQNLEITNKGEQTEPWRTGVHLLAENFGTMSGIRLNNLYVHDVNGDLRKNQEGCGIYFESRNANPAGRGRGRGNRAGAATTPAAPAPAPATSPPAPSRFDDLVIENCLVVRTDRNGICQRTTGGGDAARSTRVVIRNNRLEDIGGDGIKLWGSNGGLVEHNVIKGGRMRCTDAAAGIWPFASDDSLIQFNEVSGMKGTNDGQGFDSDYQCRRSVFQYNYSHDNDGGFFLLCAPGNSYCEGTIIRYNVSQNDGVNSARVFHFGGASSDSLIHNNIIYIGPNQDLPLILHTDWSGGNARNTRFFNNIFYIEGKVRFDWGKSADNLFENNIFFGNIANPPQNANGSAARPALVNPGGGKEGLASLSAYKWADGATIPRGKAIPASTLQDFFGTPIPANRPPAIGIYEPPQP